MVHTFSFIIKIFPLYPPPFYPLPTTQSTRKTIQSKYTTYLMPYIWLWYELLTNRLSAVTIQEGLDWRSLNRWTFKIPTTFSKVVNSNNYGFWITVSSSTHDLSSMWLLCDCRSNSKMGCKYLSRWYLGGWPNISSCSGAESIWHPSEHP